MNKFWRAADLIDKIEHVLEHYGSYIDRPEKEINRSLLDKNWYEIDQRTQAKELGLLITSAQNFQGVFQEFLASDKMQIKSKDQVVLSTFRDNAALTTSNLNKCIDTLQSVLMRIRPFTKIDAENVEILVPVLVESLPPVVDLSIAQYIAQYMD